MSSARITIGGMDVNQQPAAGASLVVDRARYQADGGHAPVLLTVEHPPRSRCPLPLVISVLAVLGLLLSLVLVLNKQRGCCRQGSYDANACRC